MHGPPSIQVTGNSIRVCGRVTAGENISITVTQSGSSTPVHEHETSFPVSRRECYTFTLGNGTYEVSITAGEYTYEYTITVPDVPNTETAMNSDPNNPPEGGGG